MPVPTITRERLVEVVSYDPERGRLVWSGKARPGVRNGDVAGNLHPSGYRRVVIDGTAYLEHRLVWLYVKGEWPARQIDHIDRDRSNNRHTNLRDVSASKNQQNCSLLSANSSGLRGVTWHRRLKKWRAAIKHNGMSMELGVHATKELAQQAYLTAKRQMHVGFVEGI